MAVIRFPKIFSYEVFPDSMNAYQCSIKITATIEDRMPIVGFEPVPSEHVLISVPNTLTTTPTTVDSRLLRQRTKSVVPANLSVEATDKKKLIITYCNQFHQLLQHNQQSYHIYNAAVYSMSY
jgi:hypothetical protein